MVIESVSPSTLLWLSLYLEPRNLKTGKIDGAVRRFRTPYLGNPSSGSGSGTT